MKSELNPRQWALYRFLKEQGDTWTTQFDAASALCKGSSGEFYSEQDGNADKFHDSHARQQMTADIRAINESGVIQKVIVSSKSGIKIANEAEFKRYIQAEINAAVRKLNRARRKAAKGYLDGQMRFVLNSERDTVKAFLDSDKGFGERLLVARVAKGITAHKVALILRKDGVPIDAPMISRFENGHCLPNKATLAKLAAIYGVEAAKLTGEDLPALEIVGVV